MATKHLTPGVREPKSSEETPNTSESALREVIEAERRRLMRAEAVLHCVAIAMDDEDRDDASGPHYPTLIELSREIVKTAIDRLDSVRVKAALEKDGVRGVYEVKERAVGYAVH